MNFEINLFFLTKPFFMTEKSWQKLKYLQNEKSFNDEIKTIFHYFERDFNEAKNTNIFGRLEPTLIVIKFFKIPFVSLLNVEFQLI